MIHIGKIIYNEKLLNHKELPYVYYQKIPDTPKIDKQLPTLIVGWKLVKELILSYPHDILEKEIDFKKINLKIKERYFWEFSSSEDIVQYSIGIDFFIKRLPYLFITNFEYKNIDPFFHDLFTIDAINKHIPDGGNLYVYKKDMAYYLVDKTIYGVKLSIYDYIGIDDQFIIDALIAKSKNHLLDDSTEYQKYYKQFPEFGFLKRSMVVFLFS